MELSTCTSSQTHHSSSQRDCRRSFLLLAHARAHTHPFTHMDLACAPCMQLHAHTHQAEQRGLPPPHIRAHMSARVPTCTTALLPRGTNGPRGTEQQGQVGCRRPEKWALSGQAGKDRRRQSQVLRGSGLLPGSGRPVWAECPAALRGPPLGGCPRHVRVPECTRI